VHDDHVKKVFTAEAANRLWLTDITEHPTAEGKLYLCAIKAEGKLYLCAIKDVYSGRIVGYSIDTRHASGPGCRGVAQRRPVAGPGRDGGALGSG
jgi:putative transposase